MKSRNKYLLIIDLAIILFSIVMAIILSRTDLLVNVLISSKKLEVLGSLVAGILFTSVFTTAPAVVTLGEIAQANSVWLVAFFGAIGAAVGDWIIFRFVGDRFSRHLVEFVRKRGWGRIKRLLNLKHFKRLAYLLGWLIIASPLPDELGVILLGFSKMKQSLFLPLSFAANFIGILLVGIVARALV